MDTNEYSMMAAAMGMAGSVLGSGINAIAASSLDKATRKWSEKMYKLQWADQLGAWNMQNQYNHPIQQMQRLREASLNPNLIYSSNANMPSATISAPTPQAPQRFLPQIDLSGIERFAQFLQQKAMNDSTLETMGVQREVLQNQAMESLARSNQIVAQTKNIDLQSKRQIIENNIAAATEQDRIQQMHNASLLSHVQVGLARMDLKQKKFTVNRLLPLQEVSLALQNEATRAGINLTSAQIRNMAAMTQNALIQGKLLSLDYTWQEYLKGIGLDPHSSPWLTSFASGGLKNVINDVIAPILEGNLSKSRAVGGTELDFWLDRFNKMPLSGTPLILPQAMSNPKIYRGIKELLK